MSPTIFTVNSKLYILQKLLPHKLIIDHYRLCYSFKKSTFPTIIVESHHTSYIKKKRFLYKNITCGIVLPSYCHLKFLPYGIMFQFQYSNDQFITNKCCKCKNNSHFQKINEYQGCINYMHYYTFCTICYLSKISWITEIHILYQ